MRVFDVGQPGLDVFLIIMIRASPPDYANANGEWPFLEWAGQLPGPGPAVVASGPGLPAGNGTLGNPQVIF